MGRWMNPKGWAREVMEKLRGSPHSEPLTNTWTSDFLSREGEGREVIGERLRDRTVTWQVQRRLMQTVTNSFPCGAHVHRMGLRGSSDCTLPCVNELESKGRMISTTGVDGLIPKHWATFIVHTAFSKKEQIRQRTITDGSRFRGR
jgi:hypothetical protein